MGRLIVPLAVAALLAAGMPAAAILPLELTIAGPAYALVGSPVVFTGEHQVRLGVRQWVPTNDVQLYVNLAEAGRDTAYFGRWDVSHIFSARGTFHVHAVSNEGRPDEARSPTHTLVAAHLPGSATGLTALAVAGTPAVDLSWSPPADDGGAPITGYRVLRQDTTNGPWNLRATVTGTEWRDANLDTTLRYRYSVEAVTPVGISVVRPVAEVAGPIPAAPTLTATPLGGSAVVRLSAAATDAATQALEIQRSYDGGATWHRFSLAAGTSLTADDALNFAGAMPAYRALARSVVGLSPATPATVLGEAPGAVQNFRYTIDSQVRLHWDAPADGGVVQQYRVRNNGFTIALLPASITTTVVTITGPHSYVVDALNYAGAGPVAGPLTVPPPPAPLLTATPRHLDARLDLLAVSGGEGTQTLDLQRSSDGGATWATVATGPAPELAFVQTLNFASSLPLFRAVARGPAGASDPTAATVVGDLPGAVTGLHMTTDTAVRLHWTAPVDGGPIQQYRLRDGGAVFAHYGPTTTSVTLTPQDGRSYAFTVEAVSYVGSGAASNTLPVTLTRAGAPVVSLDVREEYRQGRVNVTWSEPSNGGANILGYDIYRTPGTWGPRSKIASVGPSTFRLDNQLISGDGRTYTWEIQAITAMGAGHFGVASTTLDLQWAVTVDIVSFTVCETLSGSQVCTTVAPGGTFHRAGNGQVTVKASLEGLLTRKGVPQAGQSVTVKSIPYGDDEFSGFTSGTTGSDGRYTAIYSDWRYTPTSCQLFPLDAEAWFTPAPIGRDAASITICP